MVLSENINRIIMSKFFSNHLRVSPCKSLAECVTTSPILIKVILLCLNKNLCP